MKARFEEEFSLLNDAEDWETAVTLRVTTQATDALFEVQRLISGAKVLTNGPYTGMDTSRYILFLFWPKCCGGRCFLALRSTSRRGKLKVA